MATIREWVQNLPELTAFFVIVLVLVTGLCILQLGFEMQRAREDAPPPVPAAEHVPDLHIVQEPEAPLEEPAGGAS
jgi:hypothetical protein